MTLEIAQLNGQVVETKREVVGGVDTGIITGHIATWQSDNWNGIYGMPDRILKGAYIESIQEHKARNNRQVRMKREHVDLIGGFPIETVREDNIGLIGEGHVDLDTQMGQETYSLARKGVLVDFSIGHIVRQDRIEDGERLIMNAMIMEGSITEEPKNQRANVRELKNAHFADLPVAPADTEFDREAALTRVMELKFADGNGAHAFVGEHLIADVIDGRLTAIPAAVQLAAQEIKSSGEDAGQNVIERYLSKMKIDSPFEEKKFFTVSDVDSWTNAEYKQALTDTGRFSNGAIRALIARSKGKSDVPSEEKKALGSLVEKIRQTQRDLN